MFLVPDTTCQTCSRVVACSKENICPAYARCGLDKRVQAGRGDAPDGTGSDARTMASRPRESYNRRVSKD